MHLDLLKWITSACPFSSGTATADFVKKMMGRVNYGVLKAAAEQLGVQGLPATFTATALEDSEMVQALHHSLLEVHLEEGALVCPETGRRFPVSRGIPNMLLNEDEV